LNIKLFETQLIEIEYISGQLRIIVSFLRMLTLLPYNAPLLTLAAML